MNNKLFVLVLFCFSCEVQKAPEPLRVPKAKAVYGLQPHPTGSSFYPIFIPIIKTYGK